jgi:hypothetical protein
MSSVVLIFYRDADDKMWNKIMSSVVLVFYCGADDKMWNKILLMRSSKFVTNNCNKIDKLQFTVAELITYKVFAIYMH